MIRLIVNADDFGYSRGVNFGIIDSHRYGIVNSTTMMMNMPGVDHAIKLAKENPSLQVGVHLVLTCGKPILSDVSSLVDERGNFKKLSVFRENRDVSLSDLEREWTAQIERFIDSGLIPTHFDSHHHVHTTPEFLPVIQRLSKKYQLSARSGNELKGVPSFTEIFLHGFYGEGATYEFFNKLPELAVDGQTIEVMCHPGYLDSHLFNGSSYAFDRVKETEILTTVSLPSQVVLL